ncbi:MAG: GNAT family N-acetyltransferase [Promethearchaeota archaeon]
MFEKIEIIEELDNDILHLRKIGKEDVQFFYESLTHAPITIYLSLGALQSLEHARRVIKNYMKSWEQRLQFNYVIELKFSKLEEKIGLVSLWNISWLHRRAEIGIWLLPKYWKFGYGKKSVNLIKIIGFNHLYLNRLEAHIAIENLNSIKMFKSCNFEEEGILKQYLNLNNMFQDAVVLSCLKGQ